MMNRFYKKQDNGVNEAVSKVLTESRPAGDVVGCPRSSSSESLAIREGNEEGTTESWMLECAYYAQSCEIGKC